MGADCDRCGREVDDVETVTLVEERELCIACQRGLQEDVDYYHVHDRYTEEHHNMATSLLGGYEEIECVLSSYEHSKIIVHTPYVCSAVVKDVCEHFGFHITKFGPIWQGETELPCMDDHGDMFSITLSYTRNSIPPTPTHLEFTETHIEDIDANDKQFDRKV